MGNNKTVYKRDTKSFKRLSRCWREAILDVF